MDKEFAKFMELRDDVIEAEEILKRRKNCMEEYAKNDLLTAMNAKGIETFEKDGFKLRVCKKSTCSVTDKESVVAWAYDNEPKLIKDTCTVIGELADKLTENGIPFKRDVSVNTTSLKAVLDKGTTPPDGCVYDSYMTVELKLK